MKQAPRPGGSLADRLGRARPVNPYTPGDDAQPDRAREVARARHTLRAAAGDPREHHAAGFAKVMCSAVFVSGLDPVFAAEHVGYFTAPYEVRAGLGKPEIDR